MDEDLENPQFTDSELALIKSTGGRPISPTLPSLAESKTSRREFMKTAALWGTAAGIATQADLMAAHFEDEKSPRKSDMDKKTQAIKNGVIVGGITGYALFKFLQTKDDSRTAEQVDNVLALVQQRIERHLALQTIGNAPSR